MNHTVTLDTSADNWYIRLKSGFHPISPPYDLHLSSVVQLGESQGRNDHCELVLHFADEPSSDDALITPVIRDIQLSKATICTFSTMTPSEAKLDHVLEGQQGYIIEVIGNRDQDDIVVFGKYLKPHPLTNDEVVIQDVIIGDGSIIKEGSKATVWYTSKIVETDYIYENVNATNSAPAMLHIGSGENIKGWEEGMIGMHSGGRRIMTIPPSKAYGPKGHGLVPPNSTVQIECHLIGVADD